MGGMSSRSRALETGSAMSRQQSTRTIRLSPLARVAAGAPIVVAANRYQDTLFNGLLAAITSIDGPLITALCDGEREHRELLSVAQSDIELAYGIICHKA
jgi:hypothetical protein